MGLLAGMESHYRDWHHEHIARHDLKGNATIPGSVTFADGDPAACA